MNKHYRFSSTTYGRRFDADAQRRMVAGSRALVPWLAASESAGHWLEIGPHLTPLLDPATRQRDAITYVDADLGVANQLRERHRGNPRVDVVTEDLNGAPGPLRERLLASRRRLVADERTRGIVLSHVLNYLDYPRFLALLDCLAGEGTRLFLNHVVDYGLPDFFSPGRPRTDAEVVAGLERAGWQIVRRESLPSSVIQQEYPRLLLQAEKSKT